MFPSLRPLRRLLLVGRTVAHTSLAPASALSLCTPASLALPAISSSTTTSFPRGISSSSAAAKEAGGGEEESLAPPKAVSAYSLFFKEAYPALKAELPEGSKADIGRTSRAISARFHALPAEERAVLARRADELAGRSPPEPKPKFAYHMFVREHFKEAQEEAAAGGASSKREETQAAMKVLGARWKALTLEEQQRHDQKLRKEGGVHARE